jgi:hypothetical protein
MKITKSLLKQIIEEESEKLLSEQKSDWNFEPVKKSFKAPDKMTSQEKRKTGNTKIINPVSTAPDWVPDWLAGMVSGRKPQERSQHGGFGYTQEVGVHKAGTPVKSYKGKATPEDLEKTITRQPTGEYYKAGDPRAITIGDPGLKAPFYDPIDLVQDIGTGGATFFAKQALKRGGKTLGKKASEEVPSSAIEQAGKSAMKKPVEPLDSIEKAFDSGVINFQEFSKWYEGELGRKPSREEILPAWKKVTDKLNPEAERIRASDWVGKDNQLERVYDKYAVGVDPKAHAGGYIESFANNPGGVGPIWDKSLETAISAGTDRIPGAVANKLALANRAFEKGGKKLTGALFHEIGHVTLLKNPQMAKTFLDEYSKMVSSRINNLTKKTTPKFQALAGELLEKGYTLAPDPKTGQSIESIVKNFNPKEKREFLRALDLQMFRKSANRLGQARESGDIRRMMSSDALQSDYAMWRKSNEFRKALGVKPRRKTYMANFEEAFAELFEKTTRKTLGSRTDPNFVSQSKNFPETAEKLTKLIQKDITPLVKEALFRLQDYRYLLL